MVIHLDKTEDSRFIFRSLKYYFLLLTQLLYVSIVVGLANRQQVNYLAYLGIPSPNHHDAMLTHYIKLCGT